MSTRTYSGTLILEGIFDAIPSSNTQLSTIANQVFSPQVAIVESDCGTQLGNVVPLTFESEGLIEALTGSVITPSYIENQLELGIYMAQVRSAAYCISKGGLCRTCYRASRPRDTNTTVGGRVKFDPEFVLQTESVSILVGNTATLNFSSETYDTAYVYQGGNLIAQNQYTIVGDQLTILYAHGFPTNLTVKYTVVSRVPFFYWLANTFSGSLLGIKALPIDALSLKPSLFSSLIPEGEIDTLVEKIRRNLSISDEIREYLNSIPSSMERALLAIAVDSLFSNATA